MVPNGTSVIPSSGLKSWVQTFIYEVHIVAKTDVNKSRFLHFPSHAFYHASAGERMENNMHTNFLISTEHFLLTELFSFFGVSL